MRKIMLGLAAAGLLFTAVPAFSQVGVGVGPGGVGVEVGRDRDRDRDYREGDRHERRHCRTITERHRRQDGTVVVRHVRRCE
jgi:hypothetical protein